MRGEEGRNRATPPVRRFLVREKGFLEMMKASLITTAACLTLSGAAVADFTGFENTYSQYNDGVTNWDVLTVYATFDTDTDQVLNVYNADIFTADGGGFNHNDLADAQGGSWKPSFSFDIAPAYDPNRDSFVTVGYGVGALASQNQTGLDPGFTDAPSQGFGPFVPLNAGWFNGAPGQPQYAIAGEGGFDYALRVGHFVWDLSRNGAMSSYYFKFSAEIGYKDGDGNTLFGSGEAIYFPTPGALALLGLGGFATRHRRR